MAAPTSERISTQGPRAIRPLPPRGTIYRSPGMVPPVVQIEEEELLGPPSSNGPPALRPADLAAFLAKLP